MYFTAEGKGTRKRLLLPSSCPRFPEAAVCSLNGLAAAAVDAAAAVSVFVGGGGGKTSDVMSRDSKCRLHCRTDGRSIDVVVESSSFPSAFVSKSSSAVRKKNYIRRGIELLKDAGSV